MWLLTVFLIAGIVLCVYGLFCWGQEELDLRRADREVEETLRIRRRA